MNLTRIRAGAFALGLILPSLAWAQATPTFQSGPMVAPHDLAKITRNGQIQDVGGLTGDAAAGRGANPFAITDNHGCGLQFNTGATTAAYSYFCVGHDANGNAIVNLNGTSYPMLGTVTGIPVAVSRSALAALSTATYASVLRAGYGSAGDTPPLLYNASGSPCPINAGAGDGGSQVPSADGRCWIALFPPGGADVRWWGADMSGIADSSAALSSAGAAASHLWIPAGILKIGTPVAFAGTMTISCAGRTATTIKANIATGDILRFNGVKSAIRGCGFDSLVTRTGGNYVYAAAGQFHADDTYMNAAAIGYTIGSGLYVLHNVEFRNTVPATTYADSSDIVVNGVGGAAAAGAIDGIVSDVDNVGAGLPRSCIHLVNVDAIEIMDIPTIGHCQSGLLIDPASPNVVLDVMLSDGYIDHMGNYGIEVTPGTGGAVTRIHGSHLWVGSAGIDNIHLSDIPGGQGIIVDGFECDNCQIALAGRYGWYIGQNWSGVRQTGGWITNSTTADVHSATGTTAVSFRGIAHNHQGLANSPLGYDIGANAVDWQLQGNDLVGVTTKINNPGNIGTTGFIKDNPGYNPVGDSTFTLASTATHCAGPTPEQDYIFANGATISSLIIGATAVDPATKAFHLVPFQCFQPTYTGGPPTWNKSVE